MAPDGQVKLKAVARYKIGVWHTDLIYFELQAIGDSCMPYGLIFYLSHLFAFSIFSSFGMGHAACPSIILEWFNFCQGLRCIAGDCKADVSCCAPRLNGWWLTRILARSKHHRQRGGSLMVLWSSTIYCVYIYIHNYKYVKYVFIYAYIYTYTI